MRGPRIYDVLSPPDVICSVVESCQVMVIYLIAFEKNQVAFFIEVRRSPPGLEPIQNVVFQSR